MIRQLEQQLSKLRPSLQVGRPSVGWVKTIREGLGMTAEQLGKRLNVSQQRISELEKNEAEGSVALKSIKAAAEALNCHFVYFLVPKEPIGQILENQAERIAQRRFATISHSMELEDQLVNKAEQRLQISELAQELLTARPKELWNDK